MYSTSACATTNMNMWRQNSRAGARRSGSGFRLQAGACAAVALLMSAVAPPSLSIAAELPYNESGITGYFDTTVSIGTAIRTQGRDKAIIAIANGGYAPSFNEDDGNLNYNKGDFVSANVKDLARVAARRGQTEFLSAVRSIFTITPPRPTTPAARLCRAKPSSMPGTTSNSWMRTSAPISM